MILADENVHSYIIKTLRDAGITVFSIAEIARGIKDEQVIEWAIKNDCLLLTEDKDFGEWVFAHHVAGLSILFLRYHFTEFQVMAHTIKNFLKISTLQHPVYVTITPKKIRIRQL